MSAPADDDVVVHGDAERGGDVDDRFRHLDVRTRRRGIAARMVVHQDDRSIACCMLTSAIGRYCCKSRKSNHPKNLAKAALWTSLLLLWFSMPLRKSMIDFR
jgi:hypothetical protein